MYYCMTMFTNLLKYLFYFSFFFKCISEGSKLKDFLATIQTNANIQSEITKLRYEVEEYAKQFPTIGFDKETMKYRN